MFDIFEHLRSVAIVLVVIASASMVGCGLTGGGIPPGPIGGGASGDLPTSGETNYAIISGRVQSSQAPYDVNPSATVTIYKQLGGSLVVGPQRVAGDGGFVFSSMPSGNFELEVNPTNPALQPLWIPFQMGAATFVQVVAAPLPVGAVFGSSISLTASSTHPTIHQIITIQAQLTGASPTGLAPSWLSYGTAGYLTASGPTASFNTQAPGQQIVNCISGSVTASVTLSVPTGQGGSSGSNTPGGAGNSGGSGGSGTVTSGP